MSFSEPIGALAAGQRNVLCDQRQVGVRLNEGCDTRLARPAKTLGGALPKSLDP